MENECVLTIRRKFFALADEKYADFQAKLTPTVPREKFIGVRTPDLKKLAKELKGTPLAEEFISSLPHEYFEENNLHGFLLDNYKDFDECLSRLEKFLPFVDNWATCDQTNPSALKKNKSKLLVCAERWLNAESEFVVRYAIGVFMRYFLGENFKMEYAERIASLKREEYYIVMMQGWYFATALAKNYEETIKFFTNKKLLPEVFSIAIKKSCESFRITPERKEYLRLLKTRRG